MKIIFYLFSNVFVKNYILWELNPHLSLQSSAGDVLTRSRRNCVTTDNTDKQTHHDLELVTPLFLLGCKNIAKY